MLDVTGELQRRVPSFPGHVERFLKSYGVRGPRETEKPVF